MGGTKRAKHFFQKHTNSASKKCWGKNRRKKVRKTFFLYSHEYRDKKWGEQNARNNFSRNTLIVRAKNVGEKNRRKKVRKTFFYIHTNIVTKKWGGKNARNNFSKTQE